MLGSVSPYNRQVCLGLCYYTQLLFTPLCWQTQIVISTGKADWEKKITDAKESLAAYLHEIQIEQPEEPKSVHHATVKSPRQTTPGLFRNFDSTRVSVLNGSHRSICDEDDNETVLVFPDFKVVTEVERSLQGAHDLWDSSLDPSIGRTGAFPEKDQLKTWVLPYSCVILLCESGYPASASLVSMLTVFHNFPGSHKKRDNRCGIAAPKLEHGSWTL